MPTLLSNRGDNGRCYFPQLLPIESSVTSKLSPVCDISEDSSKSSYDPEYTDCKTTYTGGKNYTKARTFSITEESCILADRRLTSIRQQYDQLLAVVGSEKIVALPSTIFRKREQCRLKALRRCEADLNQADALQLYYDGKIINKIDRYVFIGQYYDPINTSPCELWP